MFLDWFAGVPAEDIDRMPARTRLLYQTVGLVVLGNALLLAAVWSKVGYRYFGPVGILVPGLTLPFILVLGLDRLIGQRRRHLDGEFSGLNVGDPAPSPRRREALARWLCAVVLGLFTTTTFMLDQSAGNIRRYQQAKADRDNAPLRAELEERAQAGPQLARRQAEARIAEIEAEQARLQPRLAEVEDVAARAEAAARGARDEVAAEAGGLGEHRMGEGPRHHAQVQIAEQNERSAQTAREHQREYQARAQALVSELATQRHAAAEAEQARHQGLAGVEAAMATDPRHVRVAEGLFADATTFMNLFDDPSVGPGQKLFATVMLLVMIALESIALIAFALCPQSPLDVLRQAGNREAASAVVAEAITLTSMRQAGLNTVNDFSRRAAPRYGPADRPAASYQRTPPANDKV